VRRPFLVTVISLLMIVTGALQVLFGAIFIAKRADQAFLDDAQITTADLTRVAAVLIVVGVLSVVLAFSLLRGSRVARAFVALLELAQIAGGIYTIVELDSGHRASGIGAIAGAVIVLYFLFATQKAKAFFA
jgi:hypothetical protein